MLREAPINDSRGAANSLKTQSVTPGWPQRPQLEERILGLEGSSLTLLAASWEGDRVLGRVGGKVALERYILLRQFEDLARGIFYLGLH